MPPPTPMSMRSSSSAAGHKPRSYLGAHTLQSFGKGTNENQDCFVASSNGNKCLAGVFDGHGEKGKRISEFAKSALSKNLFSHKDLHNDPRFALESAYKDTQSQIVQTHGRDAAESGTTAVACYQHRDRLFIANVGDSRAVLGRCDTARKGGLKAVELTSDQKPSRADEKKRILAAGGKVDQLTFPVWNAGGGVRLMRGGPERVMDASGFGGLAMSRSLGDLSLRPYVSSQPEVCERKLDSKDRFLVLGSDGVWDQMSSQEAVDIASRVSDPAHAAREIANQARRRWQSETEGLLSDDITAVVVRLEHDHEGGNAAASAGVPTRARTSQNFFSRSQSGAMTPLSNAAQRGDGGLYMDRFDRAAPNRLNQTIGGPAQRELWGPSGGQVRHRSVTSEGRSRSNGHLGHSKSDPSIGYKDSHGRHQGGSLRRNDLMRPAGR
jgi:serine/threonine protein phosphatase PrpC